MSLHDRLMTVNHSRQRQDAYKRVLCVCSAGMIRSATSAWILSNYPFNFNTRAAGTKPYALVPVDQVLVEWADEIVFMELEHMEDVLKFYPDLDEKKTWHVLGCPDDYDYREKELYSFLNNKFHDLFGV